MPSRPLKKRAMFVKLALVRALATCQPIKENVMSKATRPDCIPIDRLTSQNLEGGDIYDDADEWSAYLQCDYAASSALSEQVPLLTDDTKGAALGA